MPDEAGALPDAIRSRRSSRTHGGLVTVRLGHARLADMTALDSTAAVGVIGAGTMGAGIAQVAALAGHEVRLLDLAEGAAENAVRSIGERLARSVTKGRLSAADADATLARLHPAADVADLAGCALVVEAIVEELAPKAELFRALEAVCEPTAILASNTSSLSISDLAAGAREPGRIAGLHFFNPAPVLPLVEVISGEKTDPATVDTLVETTAAWGKTPVRATSTPGFIVNRVARPFYAEAFRLLAAGGVDAATIDAVLRESGGFRMGPCELTDLIGHDVNAAVTHSVFEAFGQDPRFETSPVQDAMVAAGQLGRKSGQGFYVDGRARPEPATSTAVSPGSATVRLDGELAQRLSGRGTSPRSESADVELRLTDGRTAAQHTGGGPQTVILVDLALDYEVATRVGIAAPAHAPGSHVDAAVGFLHGLGFAVTVLPDTPGLVVARTVAMLAAFAADAVDAGVATAEDVDTAMRLGLNYPRGPYEWGAGLGWSWVVGVLDALAAAEDPVRYRVSPALRSRAASGAASPTGPDPAHALAQRSADAMWAGDAASQALGMTRLAVEPGRARFSMTVRPDMVNGHGICHGGLIFALADTTFAFACNSYNRNTVAQTCDITFLTPAHLDDTLVAVAQERYRHGRNGVYDVTVYRADPANGEIGTDIVAEFRGRSREIPGTLVEPDVEEDAK